MNTFLWLAALGGGFLAYLIYTRQHKWLVSVVRNSALGIGGILLANFALSGTGIAVGINALTVLVVGILGAPGFVLLYATRWFLG
ncbi:MAG: pro-sigmaK processing inhibitor BofA family protein [Defluviitaleaceae bacterium]|nr:pro-sigmaK processing inhibitor BofA family protein [Defluviitaleaceae bacterium]